MTPESHTPYPGAAARRPAVAWFRALALGGALAAMTPVVALAVAFSSDVVVQGTATFDQGFALADGIVTQIGGFSVKQAGVDSAATISQTTVGGTTSGTDSDGNPFLTGTLTDLGDGFGVSGDVSAAFESEFALGWDLEVAIANNSVSDTYVVTLAVNLANAAQATGTTTGDGQFVGSEYAVSNETAGAEVFASEVISDTEFGDERYDRTATPPAMVDLGSFGALVSDSGLFSFDLTLVPGDMVDLSGLWTLEGGVFEDSSGTATLDFSAFLSVQDVVNQSAPTPNVPEPGTLLLLGGGLIGLALGRRRA